MQKGVVRGLDRARVLLGCLQPGQASSTFSDALNRLADRLHYLNSSGDKTKDATRFWFDTRANLRREMEDRKGRFNDQNEVRDKLADVLRKLMPGVSFFEGSDIFTPHADVPDDGALRLVVLPPDKFYTKQEMRVASDEVMEFLRNHGQKPRYRGNRLIFIAPEHASLPRVRDCVRTALAWNSIVLDVKEKRLNIDGLQEEQAKKELQSAEDVLPRVARECYKWLLCPVQTTPEDRQASIEAFSLNTSGSALGAEIQRVYHDNELVISAWSPIHLRDTLKKLYWRDGKDAVGAMAFWEDMQRYLYLPRLDDRHVLEQAITRGAGSKDFFGTAYGQTGDVFDGFKFGDANVQFDDTLFAEGGTPQQTAVLGQSTLFQPPVGGLDAVAKTGSGKPKSFYGSVEVSPATAKMRLVQLAEEIISNLVADPPAEVKITVEINANFPNGASDQIRRAVAENAKSLGFKTSTWE
jgi:predicted AAA+ superfamily ATPase